jgi:hypothetical protein
MDELLHLTLGGGVDAPRHARTALSGLRESLAELGSPVRQLVGELVADAVTGGGTGRDRTFSLRTESGPDLVHVEIVSPGTALEARPGRPIDPLEQSFGAALLDGLSDRWGVKGNDETTVWFEIDRKGGPQRRPGDS